MTQVEEKKEKDDEDERLQYGAIYDTCLFCMLKRKLEGREFFE